MSSQWTYPFGVYVRVGATLAVALAWLNGPPSPVSLHLFGQAVLIGKIEMLMPRIVEALQEKGYKAEAADLRQEVEARLAEAPPGRRPPPGARPSRWPSFARAPMARRELPGKCSACGAPVKPDDITWLDPYTAECPYCGSVLKTTQGKAGTGK